ncbi:MAG: hypothetical protein K0U93_26020 [Gammaproteobacteria bacterium]|nr:hypothetical protein [Gammaproteobacteria bacterium]
MDIEIMLLMLGLFILAVLPAVIFGTRCTSCRRFRALVRTGESKGGENFFDSKQEQWRCRYCDNTFWKLGDSEPRNKDAD